MIKSQKGGKRRLVKDPFVDHMGEQAFVGPGCCECDFFTTSN